MNLGEGLELKLETFARGGTPVRISALANTVGPNSEDNLEWIRFSPSQLLTLSQATFEPCLDHCSPLSGLSASILLLSNPFMSTAARMKPAIVYEVVSSV